MSDQRLATYTNTENHPGVIRSRTAAEKKKQMDKLAAAEAASERAESESRRDEDDDSSGSETEREENYRTTTSRPKGESTDDKKARKAAVKAERAVSRPHDAPSVFVTELTAVVTSSRKEGIHSYILD